MSSLAYRLAAARRRREAGRGENLAARIVRALETWRRRARSRTELARLGECELRDIGLTPADAARECRKPFWLG